MVQRTINYYSFQPGAKTHFAFVRFNVSKSVQKSFLHHIFGFCRLVYDAHANIVHWFVIQLVQLKLRFLASFPALVDDFLVNIFVKRFQFFIVSESMTTVIF
jgi:hypothetical protein